MMASPHMRRPAALARGEPYEDKHAGNREDSNAHASKQFAFVADVTDKLEIAADWKDDLQARLARGQLILETIGLSAKRHDELIARTFVAVCHALAEHVPGSLVQTEERGAA
jgi:hypothetical protein